MKSSFVYSLLLAGLGFLFLSEGKCEEVTLLRTFGKENNPYVCFLV